MTTTTLHHRHSVDVPIRRWVAGIAQVVAVVAGLTVAALAAGAGSVTERRSAITVVAGLLCAPISVAGLAGLWWGILTLGPTLLLIDHLSE